MRRAGTGITKTVGEDQRVKASTLPGKTDNVVIAEAIERVCNALNL